MIFLSIQDLSLHERKILYEKVKAKIFENNDFALSNKILCSVERGLRNVNITEKFYLERIAWSSWWSSFYLN